MHPYLLDVSSWIYLKLAFKFPMVINLPCSRPGVNISRTVGCGQMNSICFGVKREFVDAVLIMPPFYRKDVCEVILLIFRSRGLRRNL